MMSMLKEKLLQSYDAKYDIDGIKGERVAQRLHAISEIGLSPANGSNRSGYSKEELAAKQLVIGWMKEAGLEVRQDEAGNVFGRLEGKQNDLPVIMSGSHVDSVPEGGHFDGPLGVIAALEVVEAWKESGYQPIKPYEIVVFSDEEGSRFMSSLQGSKAMMGLEKLEDKLALTDGTGATFTEVLAEVGLDAQKYLQAQRDPQEIDTYVEVHIEQGKRLEKLNLPCGIVTGIAGSCRIEITFHGKAGHAGNTPMDDRQDALLAASDFVVAINKLPHQYSDSAVATVGKLNVEPNGVNVIAGKVNLFVDTRDIYKDKRDQLVDHILKLSSEIAEKHHVTVEHNEKSRATPLPIRADLQEKLSQAIEKCGIEPFYLPSGAGHDALIVGSKLPSAMIFVQSKDGVSHNPAEWSELSDCVQSIRVLKTFIEELQENK